MRVVVIDCILVRAIDCFESRRAISRRGKVIHTHVHNLVVSAPALAGAIEKNKSKYRSQ